MGTLVIMPAPCNLVKNLSTHQNSYTLKTGQTRLKSCGRQSYSASAKREMEGGIAQVTIKLFSLFLRGTQKMHPFHAQRAKN